MTSQKSSSDLTKSLNLNYGRILLTLENCLLSEDKLLQTPSRLDGLTSNIETALRILGCELIQTAGILLKLPQVAMATGQVLFQRFYYSKSFVRHSMETTAMACICLASKIEEAPRRVRDVINVFNHIKQLKDEKTIEPLILDQFYINLKNQVIKAERRVLKELGFCVHVKHPHKLIVMFLQVLNCEKNAKLMQLAWNYMNDALRTDVFMKYQPETVACACIYLTARKLHMSLPKNPDWFSIFRVTRDDIHNVCFAVLNLYARGKPDALELERAIQELRLHYQEERSKARSSSSGKNSPADTNSPGGIQERPSGGSHNAWGGFISRSGSHHVPSTETEKKKIKSKTPSPGRSPSNRSSKKYRRHRSRSLTKSRTQSPNDRKQKSHKSQHTQRKHSRSHSGSPFRKNKKHR